MSAAFLHSRYGVSAYASGIGCALLILSSNAALAQASAPADRQVSVFFAPFHDLAPLDVEVMSQARRSIDLASGHVPGEPVLQTLLDAARRQVRIRLYLPEREVRSLQLAAEHPLARLAALPLVEIRLKPEGGEALAWRAYIVDGRLVRSGGADLASVATKRSDVDLLLLTAPDIVRAYEGAFTVLWERGVNAPFKGR